MSVTSSDHSGFVTLKARLCNRDVQFMVDSGASNNFIALNLLKALGIESHKGPRVRVRLADASTVVTDQFISVLVDFGGGVSSLLRFTVLDVECPSILGMPFLERMNPAIDWPKKLVTFPKYFVGKVV